MMGKLEGEWMVREERVWRRETSDGGRVRGRWDLTEMKSKWGKHTVHVVDDEQ